MQINKQKLSENKELIISIAVAVVCVILFFIFPADNLAQKITRTIFFLVAIPALFIKLILKKNLAQFGLNLKNRKAGVIGSLFVFLLSIAVFLIIFRISPESSPRELPRFIVESFSWFLLYELLFINLYIFSFEFFFRGFIVTILNPKFSSWSVYIQAIFYAIFIAIAKGTPAQIASEAVLAVGAGIVMKKTGSIFYSYFAAIIFTIILDAYLISSFK